MDKKKKKKKKKKKNKFIAPAPLRRRFAILHARCFTFCFWNITPHPPAFPIV